MAHSKEGALYEAHINKKLKDKGIQPKSFSHSPTSNKGVDAVFTKKGITYGLEVKHTPFSSYGSASLEHDGKKWLIKDTGNIDISLIKKIKSHGVESIINTVWRPLGVPHKFTSPSLTPLQRDEDLTKWSLEGKKIHNVPTTIAVNLPPNMISAYYMSKDVNYLQIRDYGFYHFGRDVAKIKCPKFEAVRVIAEARMKKDTKNGVTYYSFNILIKHPASSRFSKSPYDIDEDVTFLYDK